MVRLFTSMASSASGMAAEKLRLDLITNNIANISTTRTSEGGPYRRRVAVFAEKLQAAGRYGVGQGVKVAAVLKDPGDPRLVHDPNHPDANADGYVALPNINIVNEMVDMITATRSYEANVTVFNAAKNMALRALDLGRG